MTGIPLGEGESQTLELEGRDALKDPKKIAEGVAAFLNSRGGDLFIGVREEKGRGVAVEGVEEADVVARRLHDALLDLIDPRPGSNELRIEVVPDAQGKAIRVQVSAGRYPPYSASGKYFTRVGASRRLMTREELADAFSGTDSAQLPGTRARQILLADRQEIQSDDKNWFWLGIQPARDIPLDVQRPDLPVLLTDREALGVPPDTPSFHVPFEPELRTGRLVAYAIPGEIVIKETVIRSDGGIRFRTAIPHLYRYATGASPRWINPEVLIGIPRSLLALVKPVLGEYLSDDDLVMVDMALFGLGEDEASLLPGRWRRPRPGQEARSLEPGEDFILSKPLELTLREIEEEPERSVARLLRELYESFGLREEAIPVSIPRADRGPGRPSRARGNGV